MSAHMDFSEWLDDFVLEMKGHIAPHQAERYRVEYRDSSERYFKYGLSPLEAVAKELIL